MDGTGGGTEAETNRMSEGETSGSMCGEERETDRRKWRKRNMWKQKRKEMKCGEMKEGNKMWRREERKRNMATWRKEMAGGEMKEGNGMLRNEGRKWRWEMKEGNKNWGMKEGSKTLGNEVRKWNIRKWSKEMTHVEMKEENEM